jgi:hypothetical protein
LIVSACSLFETNDQHAFFAVGRIAQNFKTLRKDETNIRIFRRSDAAPPQYVKSKRCSITMRVSVLTLSIASAFLAQILAPQCYANESGWLLNQESLLHGRCVTCLSASGIKVDYKKGYTLVMAAPEWKPVSYNARSKLYYTATVTQYIVKMTQTLMVSGVFGTDNEHWGKPQSCLLNGNPAVKYHFLDKKPRARVKEADCWFSSEVPVSQAVSDMQTGINHVPHIPYALIQIVAHTNVGDEGHILLHTTLCKKVVVPSGTYSYPKGYRLVGDPVQVVMGDIGKDIMDDMIESPVNR